MAEETTQNIKVLIVDDNRIYREAFRRNLMLQDYDVTEAENTTDALAKIAEEIPDVIITDLQMRTETEGLELIKSVKSAYPLIPLIMISAVGTFEEGALAQKYGASQVLSKSRIEDEIERLYTAINSSVEDYEKAKEALKTLEKYREALSADSTLSDADKAELRSILSSPETNAYVRREAFEIFNATESKSSQEDARTEVSNAAIPMNLESVESRLRELIPHYDNFSEESKESLRIAEFLYDQQVKIPGSIDFSRNIGFSYCFAVENEVKTRISKRLQKFLSHEMTLALTMEMMENNNQSLSIYFHQHLLLLLRDRKMDFTMDNVKQTLRRILEHQARYKPDGLKALGIMLVCFGRNYSWQKRNKTIKVHNPLAIKGLEDDKKTLDFAELLVNLQHLRNPYIHPEISEMEKTSILRNATIDCLNIAGEISS